MKLQYALTLKALHKPYSYEEYFDYFEKLPIEIVYKVPEIDSAGRLHYHLLIKFDSSFMRKKMCLRKYNIDYSPIVSLEAWNKYCHKDCVKRKPKKLF